MLFGGAKALERIIVDTIANVPRTATPLDAVVTGLEATAPIFEPRRGYARKRRGVIAAHAELRERELIKLASLADAIADSLRRRGVADAAAGLIAEAGIAVFKNAFERWVDDTDERDLTHHMRTALEELKAMTASTRQSSSRSGTAKASRAKRVRSR